MNFITELFKLKNLQKAVATPLRWGRSDFEEYREFYQTSRRRTHF
jgi:hypothetical protein